MHSKKSFRYFSKGGSRIIYLLIYIPQYTIGKDTSLLSSANVLILPAGSIVIKIQSLKIRGLAIPNYTKSVDHRILSLRNFQMFCQGALKFTKYVVIFESSIREPIHESSIGLNTPIYAKLAINSRIAF